MLVISVAVCGCASQRLVECRPLPVSRPPEILLQKEPTTNLDEMSRLFNELLLQPLLQPNELIVPLPNSTPLLIGTQLTTR